MKHDGKFERYTFAAVLLIFAAIVILSMLEFPANTSVEITGVVVTETTAKDAEDTSESEKSEDSGLININTATAKELEPLYGIGESKAKSIIAYREKIGGYTSTEQLKDIKGIGEKIFDRIKDSVTV